ncbi:O-phosphoseryl-tRNA(Sec) selenium transferase-like [Watersipora subatra]|uniref:O-phosphoseryl-tRNA(Sec) selenium transferase-like n=1 Tax=Watersipora subatra TaxID=2589382 RepID=UPI00355B6994
MNNAILSACSKIIPAGYIAQCEGARNSISNAIQELITKKKLPDEGWPDDMIEYFLANLSHMDTNNFKGNVGVGEREGRVFSGLVNRRHFRLAHGIGRSGDITAVQPKAAGSSLLNQLTNRLVLDSIKIAGVSDCKACFVLPMATGMALTLCMQALRNERPEAKYVLWPRIDQKSCFKSISTAGFKAVVIPNRLEGDQLSTNLEALEQQIDLLGAANILCVMSTSSCFAPRAVDNVEGIAKLCSNYGIPHLLNNAYGVQSSKCMHVIQQAQRVGRLDAFVQSTDKNYMVPVGGSIVAGFNEAFIDAIGKTYPGRASVTPSLDMIITLLSMGSSGFKALLRQRKELYGYLKEEVGQVAAKYNERILCTPGNPISIGVTLSHKEMASHELTEIGSMLFTRNVSGLRVVTCKDEKEINGHTFHGFGSHHDAYPSPYFTVAAAIGMTAADVDTFCKRLDKVLSKAYKPISD